jgi:hypothetical protein
MTAKKHFPLICVIALGLCVFPAAKSVAKDSDGLMIEPYPVAPPPPSDDDLMAPEAAEKPDQKPQEQVAKAKSDLKDMSAAMTHSKPITGRWETPAGADIKETLDTWANAAGVTMVWDVPEKFVVRDTIVMEGTFESAVAVLLEQYTAQTIRPVGNLHINPEDGQRVLIIQTLMN